MGNEVAKLDALRAEHSLCMACAVEPDDLTEAGLDNQLMSHGIDPVTLNYGTQEQIVEWRRKLGFCIVTGGQGEHFFEYGRRYGTGIRSRPLGEGPADQDAGGRSLGVGVRGPDSGDAGGRAKPARARGGTGSRARK
jgi:hypothetical protein